MASTNLNRCRTEGILSKNACDSTSLGEAQKKKVTTSRFSNSCRDRKQIKARNRKEFVSSGQGESNRHWDLQTAPLGQGSVAVFEFFPRAAGAGVVAPHFWKLPAHRARRRRALMVARIRRPIDK